MLTLDIPATSGTPHLVTLALIFLYIILFLFIFSCEGLRFSAGFSLVVASGDYFLGVVHGLLIVVASLIAERGLNSTQASVVVSPGLQSKGSGVVEHRLVAVQHVGPSWIRDWTHVFCIGRWILNHWTTKQAWHWLLILQTLNLLFCICHDHSKLVMVVLDFHRTIHPSAETLIFVI